jgi:hypothetical protein
MSDVERLTARVRMAEAALAAAKGRPNGIAARRAVRARTQDLNLLRSALRRAKAMETTE